MELLIKRLEGGKRDQQSFFFKDFKKEVSFEMKKLKMLSIYQSIYLSILLACDNTTK